MATPSIGEVGNAPCLDHSEPQAHANDATTKIPAPLGSTLPEFPSFAGPTRITMPANPIAIPNRIRADGLCPPGLSQSTITIHNVTVATSSAAIPDGTVCSAQHTPPFP